MHNFNRPISPHLTIYNFQKSSTLSIWHRISGIVMFVIAIVFIVFLNNIYFSYSTIFVAKFLVEYILFDWLLFSCKLFIIAIFLYHISNGTRHLFWDSVIHVNTSKMHKDGNILLFFVIAVALSQFYV
uniref:Succinate:cytochrome c oxidoreductase subunit 3 n=1 Tax=Pyropia dentata TaxID=76160 RepID=H3JS53_PYRDN|nr:succinate:cytochrome c oxidoreductase subunit 3 [Neoporphyra dentata]WKD83577.1 succinate:cytochrome c oxidoreductase subunit 3 [Neoporphyra dentata]BAL63251.1 succinate:cytochrome c oxidoreductase subunit 3 [Neoporphyra dentata]